MAQVFKDKQAAKVADEVAAVEPTLDTDAKEALDADIDSILDEIDEVLEVNAEDFVRGFVQKGGQ